MPSVVGRRASRFTAGQDRGSPRGAAVNTWDRNGLRRVRFPRPCAAASLKRTGSSRRGRCATAFSAAMRRGLIEASRGRSACGRASPLFSAAMRRGLIEAALHRRGQVQHAPSFPRPCAAASLKLRDGAVRQVAPLGFSAAMRRGLIEAGIGPGSAPSRSVFSAAMRRGLIEAVCRTVRARAARRFPRPCAAASLKRDADDDPAQSGVAFSAAMRRGLIEARAPERSCPGTSVFRGHAPRPH